MYKGKYVLPRPYYASQYKTEETINCLADIKGEKNWNALNTPRITQYHNYKQLKIYIAGHIVYYASK